MCRSISTLPLLWLTTVIFLSAEGIHAQGGYHYENFGNRSVLLNGNVTGSVNDLGAVYYNPARLALIENPGFLVQGKLFDYTKIKVDDFFKDQSLSNTSFNGIPGMLAGSVNFLGTTFYYSSISHSRFNSNIAFSSEPRAASENMEADNNHLKLNVNNKISEDWYGITWAHKITDNFSIGTSVFASFYEYRGGENLRIAAMDANEEVSVYDAALSFTQRSTGIYAKIAAALTIGNVEAGLNIDLPYWELIKKASFSSDELLAALEGNDIFAINNFSGLESQYRVPLGIQFGLGYTWDRNTLHCRVSWYKDSPAYTRIDIPPLSSLTGPERQLTFGEDRRAVLNFGAGGEFPINNKLYGYLSFTTDFSPFKEADEVIGTGEGLSFTNILAFDNYHYGGGVNLLLNKMDIVAGVVFTHGSERFESIRDRPINLPDLTGNSFKIGVNRWRFLLGFNLELRDLIKFIPGQGDEENTGAS